MFNIENLSEGDVELRDYTFNDMDNTVRWLNSASIKSAFGLTYNVDRESHENWLTKSLGEPLFIWAIFYKAQHVGDLIIRLKRRHFSAYFQIYIGEESCRGRGVAYTSLKLCIDYLFDVQQFHRLELHVKSDNTPAISLYKKFGFKFEGIEKESVYQDGVFVDQERWALINDYK